jgi:hypothetical protein
MFFFVFLNFKFFYEKSLDAPKSILETEKPLKTLSSGHKYIKNPKKPKKTKKNHWAGFKKKPFFFQLLPGGGPGLRGCQAQVPGRHGQRAHGPLSQASQFAPGAL